MQFKVGGTRLKQPGTKKMTQTSHKESSGPVAIMLFIVGVRYKKMTQTSHKESSGPVAVVYFGC